MSGELIEFLVDDVSEEYFIINKMCCPRCKAPKLERILQELLELTEIPKTLKDSGAGGMADRLT